MRKGFATEPIIAVAAIVIFMIIIVFSLRTQTEPSLSMYGKHEAHIHAQAISTAIDALASVDSGYIERTFEGPWDVEVKGNKAIVVHGTFRGEESFVVDPEQVRERKFKDVLTLTILKEFGPDKKIEIRKGFYGGKRV